MRPAGFRTDNHNGSLYALDGQNRTVRHNLSGNSGHGDVDTPSKCLYLPQDRARQLAALLDDKTKKVRIVYLNKKTQNLHVWNGDDSKMPEDGHPGIGIFDKQTDKLLDSWPAVPQPAVGLLPFEMHYFRDRQGDFTASRHLGHPIHKVYENEKEFDAALKASGFRPFFSGSSNPSGGKPSPAPPRP
jgi:hypothetical protein